MYNRSIASVIVAVALTAAGYVASRGQSITNSALKSSGTAISDLAWMVGSWQTAPGGRAQIEEHWTKPAGGTMIGMGRTIAGEKTVEYEFLRIEQRGDDLFYLASPKGRCPATEFKLTRLAGQEAVFENPEHDFPKRVIYRKNSDGSLTASIDGGAGTKSHVFAYLPQGK